MAIGDAIHAWQLLTAVWILKAMTQWQIKQYFAEASPRACTLPAGSRALQAAAAPGTEPGSKQAIASGFGTAGAAVATLAYPGVCVDFQLLTTSASN